MTYAKLLEYIKGMTAEQREMQVIILNGTNETYLFPTMVVNVQEDLDGEGFKPDQPLLG